MRNFSHSETIGEFAKAFVKAQAAITPAVKDAQNPYLKTRYASLNSVLESCRDALLANGLALVQSPVPAPEYLGQGFIGLETRLIHADSGEWISSVMVIPLAKQEPQALGAAISYARRYAISSMIGIVPEEENDCERRNCESLPELPGVVFERTNDANGREYVVASGNTREHAQALRKAGFSWSERRSCWYRAA